MSKKLLFLLILFISFTIYSQNPGDIAHLYGSNKSLKPSEVLTTAIQPDGKVIVGGMFTTYNGKSQNYIIRFNIDGTQDTSFNIGTSFNNYVNCILIQSNGKILVGGKFTGGLNRLNSDGSIDRGFGLNVEVFTLAQQADGKIVVGGKLIDYRTSTSVGYIARFNIDNSLDTKFKPIFNNSSIVVKSLAIDENIYTGVKIYVGGIQLTGGMLRRLNIDGTDDSTFNINKTFDGDVLSLVMMQSSFKLLIGGKFTGGMLMLDTRIKVLGTSAQVGFIDTTFNPKLNGDVKTIAVQADKKIIIGGSFTTVYDPKLYKQVSKNQICRLSLDGNIDNGFNIGTGFSGGFVNAVAFQSNGKIIVGGSFSSYNQIQTQTGITNINSDGSTDLIFNIPLGFNNSINTIVAQPDGKAIIGGKFTSYKGIIQNRICRLNPDGTIDSSFNSGTGFNDNVNLILLQPDGKILVTGSFTSYNGTYLCCYNSIIRLNSDGSIDTSFRENNGGIAPNKAFALQADGKIIVAGEFFSSDPYDKRYLIRLLSNGSLDTTFKLVDKFNNPLISRRARTVVVLPNGQIMVGVDGSGSSYFNNIILLNSNGAIADSSFGGTSTYNVFDIALQKDGKTLVRCEVNNSTRDLKLLRCNSDGSIDTTFINWKYVSDFLLLPDGKIIIAESSRLRRIDTNGQLDATFNNSVIVQGVSSISLQSDGSLLVGGSFLSYDNKSSDYLIKLFLDKTLGYENFDFQKALIYPNPVKDILKIDNLDNSNYECEIFDLQGKKINTGELKEDEINVSNLTKGIYLLKIKSGEKMYKTKFIKE